MAEQVLSVVRRDRRRWKLHRSTLVVGAIAAILMALTNLPGSTCSPSALGVANLKISSGVYDHGWPWVIARSVDPSVPSPFAISVASTVRPDERWHWSLEWRDFSAVAAVGDMALALAIVLGIGALWEWRRRRLNSVWQIRLTDVFALTLAVSLACGWWLSWHNQRVRQEQAINTLYPQNAWRTASSVNMAPRILYHWLGPARLQHDFSICDSVRLRSSTRKPIHDERLHAIEELDTLTSVHVLGPSYDDRWISAVATLRRLKVIELVQTSVTDQGLNMLVGVSRLEEVYIAQNDSMTTAAIARFRRSRPDVVVTFLDDVFGARVE